MSVDPNDIRMSTADDRARWQSVLKWLRAIGKVPEVAAGDADKLLQVRSSADGIKFVARGEVGMPTGAILAYGSSTAPTGYEVCDGAPISRTTFSDLFNIIGTSFGEGDGSTTFNKPDLRGKFLRGHDDGAGNDPDAAGRTAMNTGGNTGDNVGSIQGDGNAAHTHSFQFTSDEAASDPDPAAIRVGANSNRHLATPQGSGGTAHSDGGGNEARPKNAYVSYIIKT